VSPRRNRPGRSHRGGSAQPAPPPVDGTRARWGVETVEHWPDGEWAVRPVAGDAGKTYRCPGCDQEIRPNVGHLVAWPAGGTVEDRRHWHTGCWRARTRRAPNVQRSRNAPRYG
jgi:hypothetical protein